MNGMSQVEIKFTEKGGVQKTDIVGGRSIMIGMKKDIEGRKK